MEVTAIVFILYTYDSTAIMDFFFKFKTAGQATLVREYKRNFIKRGLIELDIWFNNQCIRKDLRPKYVSLKNNFTSSSATKALKAATVVWIKEEVKKHYFKLNLIDLKLKFLYFKITSLLHPLQWDSLSDSLWSIVSFEKQIKFTRLKSKINLLISQQKPFNNNSSLSHSDHKNNNKNNNNISLISNHYSFSHSNIDAHNSTALASDCSFRDLNFDDSIFKSEFSNNLINNSKFSNFNFHDRTLNLSQTSFDHNEVSLLNMGLKYNFHMNPLKENLEVMAVECENCVSYCQDTSVKEALRSQIAYSFNNFYKNNSRQQRTQSTGPLKSIQKKIISNNLIISKADKGNCLVILDKPDYVNKVNNFLSSEDFSQINFNPIDKFMTKFKKTIKNTHDSIIFFNSNKFKLTPINPLTPRLYGLPKIHKLNVPIRPVVSYCNSPCYKLSVWLNQLLLSLTNFKSPFAIKNSSQLAQTLNNQHVPNSAFLVSFDVTNLFPSIPANECSPLIKKLLLQTTDVPLIHVDNICTLVNLVLDQNFFIFDNKFYKQNSGLAMGSALSPLLAELFMSDLESKIINNPLFSHIITIKRYVDDIFAIFDGSTQDLANFTNFLNSLHSSITFTHEIENNSTLPFLDLNITRTNNSLKFSIYHKPTSTDSTIHFSSNHPYNQKLAAFHSYFSRLFAIPLNEHDFMQELNIIRQIGSNNGYPQKLLNKLYFKHLNKHLNKKLIFKDSLINKNKYHFSLSFWGPLSFKLKNIFQSFNIQTSFKTQHTLRSFICNSKDKLNSNDKSGVYRVSCSSDNCNTVYIGQTGRKFCTRIGEHCKEIDRAKRLNLSPSKIKSNFSRHIVTNNHEFNPETNTSFLHFCNKGNKLDLLEILEIHKLSKDTSFNSVNDQILHSSTHFFNALNFI